MRKFGLKSVLLFSVLALSVFFYGCKQPTDPDKDPDKGGGGKKGGGEVPSGPLTADVSFNNISDMEIRLDALNVGKAAQTIGMAIENIDTAADKTARFTVYKTEAQTLAVSGADAAYVTVTPDGENAALSVDLDNFDAQFEGKDYGFTLTVSEAGKSTKTYTINLNARPELTGAAVFVVDRSGAGDGVKDGKLTLITAATAASAAFGGAENTSNSTSNIAFSAVDNLTKALRWVDHNAKANTEYLIRVEGNEELYRHTLTCLSQENVIIRLRGAKEERMLQVDRSPDIFTPASWVHNSGTTYVPLSETTGYSYNTYADDAGQGWLNIGHSRGDAAGAKLTLQIEKNITLDGGAGEDFPYNSGYFNHMIHLKGKYSGFIMEEGSKTTNFKPTLDILYIISAGGANNLVWLKGGQIQNTFRNGTDKNNLIYVKISNSSSCLSVFKKTGGSFINNEITYLKLSSSTAYVTLLSNRNDYDINRTTYTGYLD
jgi:hypothetical protein